MNTKKDYKCDLCNQKKECYVFQEFNIPISVCKDCYVKLELEKGDNIIVKGTNCQLCDNTRDCYKFHHLDTAFLKSNILICKECFKKIEDLIDKVEKKHYEEEKKFLKKVEKEAEKKKEEE